MSDPNDPQSWLKKAREDLRAIDALTTADVWGVMTFHAQQAAEKALKAILVSRQADVPKTHDTGRLLDLCKVAGVDLSPLSKDCDCLASYAVEVRYPGDPADVDEPEARAAVAAAQRIFEAVSSVLEESV
jgi:HEPN domain-containing protein